MGLCFFSTRMIPKFSRRLGLIWRSIIFGFVWSGRSSIPSHLRAWRTPPWRYGLPYFLFLLHIHFSASFSQILFLECCRSSWVRWFFWLGLLILAPLQQTRFVSPLLLRTSCIKVSIYVFEKDVFYNWTDRSSMSMSKKPFWVAKESHLLTL
jgi:hypothetical protein